MFSSSSNVKWSSAHVFWSKIVSKYYAWKIFHLIYIYRFCKHLNAAFHSVKRNRYFNKKWLWNNGSQTVPPQPSAAGEEESVSSGMTASLLASDHRAWGEAIVPKSPRVTWEIPFTACAGSHLCLCPREMLETLLMWIFTSLLSCGN